MWLKLPFIYLFLGLFRIIYLIWCIHLYVADGGGGAIVLHISNYLSIYRSPEGGADVVLHVFLSHRRNIAFLRTPVFFVKLEFSLKKASASVFQILKINLSVYLSTYISIYIFVYPPINIFIYLSTLLRVYLYSRFSKLSYHLFQVKLSNIFFLFREYTRTFNTRLTRCIYINY